MARSLLLVSIVVVLASLLGQAKYFLGARAPFNGLYAGAGAPSAPDQHGGLPVRPVRRFMPDRPRPSNPDTVFTLAFTPDGKALAVGGIDRGCGLIRMYDLEGGTEVRRFHEQERTRRITFSPSGRMLASASTHSSVRVWDTRSGRELFHSGSRRPPGVIQGPGTPGAGVAFSQDGKVLACSCRAGFPTRGQVWLWDTALFRDPIQLCADPELLASVLAFSPDGTILAAGSDLGEIIVFHSQSGQLLRRWRAHRGMVAALAFTPDGMNLISGGWERGDSHGARVWEVATGKECIRLPDPSGALHAVSASADGRMVATAGGSGIVFLWDLATGKELGRLLGHTGPVYAVEFSPDGHLLASGGAGDASVLLWDVSLAQQHIRTRDGRPGIPPPDDLWRDLTSPDGQVVHRALWRLVSSGDSSVSFLREHLPPAIGPDPSTIERLLHQLASPHFTIRENATARLEEYGLLVELPLQAALCREVPLEARRRIDLLLSRARQKQPTEADLRALRAVQILEAIATPAARRLLESLGTGYPGAILTREARASARRLRNKTAGHP